MNYMLRKAIYLVILAIILALGAGMVYLITRSCDYRASFMVKTTPEIAYYHIHNWDIWNRKQTGATFEITGKTPVSGLSNRVLLKDTTLVFNWEIKEINDSTTQVRACVSDPGRKISNRLTSPFINTPFRKSVRSNLMDMMRRMELMLPKFRYEFQGNSSFEERACVCISHHSTRKGKAMSMISSVVELNQFVKQNKLELDMHPLVIIDDWDETNDSIKFDFCFPIKRIGSVPEHPVIKFRTLKGMDAVQTDFFGNYSLSDIAWYNLYAECKELGYRSNRTLIEVYHNDPHSGGDELEWKAEIFLGIETPSKQ